MLSDNMCLYVHNLYSVSLMVSIVAGQCYAFGQRVRTFNGAKNLPIADMHNLSCDPYLEARLEVPSCPQPPDELPLLWRTPTQRCTRDPQWESHWVVSGVPQSHQEKREDDDIPVYSHIKCSNTYEVQNIVLDLMTATN